MINILNENKFNRRVIDKLRANSIEKIRQYLSDYGYTNRKRSKDGIRKIKYNRYYSSR
jgi:hypothetical protein